MTPGFQWQVSMLGPVGAWYYCKEVEAACTYKAHVPSVLEVMEHFHLLRYYCKTTEIALPV